MNIENFYKHSFSAFLCLVTSFNLISCGTEEIEPIITPATKSELSFAPTVISANTEIGNPGRGFYQWQDEPIPNVIPVYDVYRRFSWRQIEPTKDGYDFSPIDNYLALLKPGQRFSFRIMPLNTVSTPYKNGADVPDYMVSEKMGWSYPFHSTRGSDSIFIPDWNDSRYLDRVEKLCIALAAKYDNDPRIGWIENSLYGNWGEWHNYPMQYPNSAGEYAIPPGTPVSNPMYTPLYAPVMPDPIDPSKQKYREGTLTTKKRILMAHTNVFKNKQLIQSTSDLPILFEILKMNRDKPIGFRRDSWGDPSFSDIQKYQTYQISSQEMALFNSKRKETPFYSENWGGSYLGDQQMVDQLKSFNVSAVAFGVLGSWTNMTKTMQESYLKCARATGFRYQITSVNASLNDTVLNLTTVWRNINMAPTFDKWNVIVYVVNPKTGVLFSQENDLQINLKDLRDSETASLSRTCKFTLLKDWKKEKILHVRVIVKDVENYLKPLNLDLMGQNPDGSYTLMTIEIIDGVASLKRIS